MEASGVFDPTEYEALAKEASETNVGHDDLLLLEAQAADRLLGLTAIAERDPELALELFEQLPTEARGDALRRLEALGQAEVAALAESLEALRAIEPALLGPPLLAPDPLEAQRLRALARQVLVQRLRVERCRATLELLESDPGGLDTTLVDRALEALLPKLGPLEPERAALRSELADPGSLQHWWLTRALPAEPDEASVAGGGGPAASEIVEPNLAGLQRWLSERLNSETGVLHLDRQEARALMADPQWEALLEVLGERVDVDAGRLRSEELAEACGVSSLEELLERSSPAPWRWLLAATSGLLDALAERPLAWAASASTSPGAVLQRESAAALLRCELEGVALLDGFGLVGWGRQRDVARAHAVSAAWLVVPGERGCALRCKVASGAVELQPSDRPEGRASSAEVPAWLLLREEDTPIALVWQDPAGAVERRTVSVEQLLLRGTGEREQALHTLLRALSSPGTMDEAATHWAAMENHLSATERSDLAGLSKLVAAVVREDD